MSARRRQDSTKAPARAQSIYRVAKRSRRFTQIPNALLRDEALTPEERGMLGFMLTFPDDWVFQAAWVRERNGNPHTGRPMGERRWNRIIARLVERGYGRRHQPRQEDGTYGPYVYEFYEEVAADRTAESAGRIPQDGDRRTEKAARRIPIESKTENVPLVVPQRAGERRPAATYLPDDWTLSEADRTWAQQEAPALAAGIDAVAAAFVDRHRSRRIRRPDWSEAWRDWYRGACERAQRRPTPGAAQPAAQGKPRNTAGHTDGHRVHDRSQAYEEARWYERGSPEFTAWRASLQREGDDRGIVSLDKAGRVKLAPSRARALVAAAEEAFADE